MSQLPALRWGLVGAARITRSALLPALRAAGQQVMAVAARDPARAAAFAAEFGLDAHADYGDLLADPRIDAVYIALTNDRHCDWAVAALTAGKHVLCEKPLALDAGQVAVMRAAEAGSGKVLMEAFCHLFHPRFADIVAAVRSGAIGAVNSLEVSFTNPLADPDDFRWQRALGGGAALDLLGYCTTLATGIIGRAPQTVAARQVLRGEVDLSIAAVLDFGDALASLQASFAGARQQRLAVIGAEGLLDIAHPIGNRQREVTFAVAGATRTYPPVDPYRLMVEDFVRGAAGLGPLAFPSAASLAAAELLDRIRHAADRREAA